MKNLRISEISPKRLTPYPRNARTHSKKHIRQIAESIKQFGWTNPILVDGEGGVIAGHGRLMAALELGLENVPVVAITSLSEAEKRAYIIADNKLAENAGWDPAVLAIELQSLLEVDIDLDITLTGFEMAEIDILIGEAADGGETEEEPPSVDRNRPAISKPGDKWEIGRHRIMCGDATNANDAARLLGDEKAQMIFTDPPYNVPVDGHVCGLGKVRHREFAMASGEMTREQFEKFLKTAFLNLARSSVDGAIHFIFMDWRHIAEVMAAAGEVYDEFKNLCIWAKTNGGMGSLYRSMHELVFVFKSGTGAHINNVELGRHGRNRTNVWTYPGINSFGGDRNTELNLHPTVKPIALVSDAIQDCSNRGGIILDVFSGSGTTLLAAEKTGRRGYGLELDPVYVDVMLRRLQAATGQDAILHEDGRTFAEIERESLASDVDKSGVSQ
ncbi:MAG: DNA methyltransferase [Alphaproteobacteria bacterium]